MLVGAPSSTIIFHSLIPDASCHSKVKTGLFTPASIFARAEVIVGSVTSIPETGLEALKLSFPRASSALKHTILPLSLSDERRTVLEGASLTSYARLASQVVQAGTTLNQAIFHSVTEAETSFCFAGVEAGSVIVISGPVVSIFVTSKVMGFSLGFPARSVIVRETTPFAVTSFVNVVPFDHGTSFQPAGA